MEIRNRTPPDKYVGERIAIIPNGESKIFGDVELVGSVKILNEREFRKLNPQHGLRVEELWSYYPGGFPVYGWRLENAQAYLPTDRIRVNKPPGARGWVTLTKEGVLPDLV
jgi:hypothetical protein